MWKYYIIIVGVLFLTGSCEKSGKKDLSLSVEGYKKLGMPDPSQIWKQSDYRQAYMVLSQLKSSQPLSLPQKGSKKSGQYFDRLVSLENLSFLKDESIPLHERAYRIQSYILIENDLADIYTNIYGEDQYYDNELIELYLFGLIITQEMLDLSYKINESNDAQDRQMQSGFGSIQYTYLTMLSYILDNQKNSAAYRIEDLERLTDSISSSVLKNKEWMEASARERLKDQMNLVIDNVSSKHIKNKYLKLIEVL